MSEHLNKAKHDLQFASDELRLANRHATAVESLLLLPIIGQVAESIRSLQALIAAREVDTISAGIDAEADRCSSHIDATDMNGGQA